MQLLDTNSKSLGENKRGLNRYNFAPEMSHIYHHNANNSYNSTQVLNIGPNKIHNKQTFLTQV